MVHVALVGGSTGFGRTLLDHLIGSEKHKITVLSREDKPDLTKLGVNVKPVDYSDHEGLVDALRGVHTIISTIGALQTYDAANDPQVNLINAAVSAGVKRFAPSEFAHGDYEGIDAYARKKLPWEAVQASGLEYTRFTCGLFTNILATGTPLVDQSVALAGLRPWNYIINQKNGTADLPSDGTQKIAWTEINDVCRFVVASLDLEKWPAEGTMYGDVASWAEVIAKVEHIRGGDRFLVKNTSIKEMEELSKDPTKRFYNQTRIVLAKGGFENDGALNALLPDVKPKTIDDCLREWWAGVPVKDPTWGEQKLFADSTEA